MDLAICRKYWCFPYKTKKAKKKKESHKESAVLTQLFSSASRFRWPCAFKPPQKDDMKSAKDQTSLPEIICSTRF